MSSWNNHPLAVAAISVAGTIGLSVLLIKEIIIPTYTYSLQNEVSRLTSKIEILEKDNRDINLTNIKLEEGIKVKETHISKLDESIEKLNNKVFDLLTENILEIYNPFPIEFRAPRNRDDIKVIYQSYPKESIDQKDGNEDKYSTIAVDTGHKLVSGITYYYRSEYNLIEKIIVDIRWHDENYKEILGDDYLQKQLISALGKPTLWSEENYFSWDIGEILTVYKKDDYSYSIHVYGDRPFLWPRANKSKQKDAQ